MKLSHAAIAATLSLALPIGAFAHPQTSETGETAAAQPERFTVETIGANTTASYDVMLIPGLASPREVWRPAAEKLAKTHRVHLVQVRGFGDDAGANAGGPLLQNFVSELADYLAVNDIEKPAVIGHSMGGLAAMMLAAQHPDLPGRIMVVDALPFFGVIFGAADVAALEPQAAGMRNMVANTPPTESKDCSAVNNNGTVPQGNMSNTQKGNCMVSNWSAAADKRVMAQAMYDGMTTDMRADIAKITAPITVVYGRDERALPTAMTDGLYTGNYAAAPQTKLVPVDQSYHFVMLDQPEKMQAALDAFLID